MKTVKEFPTWIATVSGGLLVLSFFFVQSRGQSGVAKDAGLPIEQNLVVQGLNDVHTSRGFHPQQRTYRSHGGPVPVPAKLMKMMRPVPVPRSAQLIPESADQRVASSLHIAELSLAQATAALETAKAEVDRQLSVRNESATSPN